MRYSKEHKRETRDRIVAAAARLFRAHGFDGVGVDAIMAEVGLTAGGFYAHFPSKKALFTEAMNAAAEARPTQAPKSEEGPSAEKVHALIAAYLSAAHRDRVADGCPLPTLTPDVARAGDEARAAYERNLDRYLSEIEKLLPPGEIPADERAVALMALSVGGLLLSRGVRDDARSRAILKTCRAAARRLSET